MQGQYGGLRNLRFTLGIRNLLDRAPPFSRQTRMFQVGFDPRFSDPRGRFWYGSLTYSFR